MTGKETVFAKSSPNIQLEFKDHSDCSELIEITDLDNPAVKDLIELTVNEPSSTVFIKREPRDHDEGESGDEYNMVHNYIENGDEAMGQDQIEFEEGLSDKKTMMHVKLEIMEEEEEEEIEEDYYLKFVPNFVLISRYFGYCPDMASAMALIQIIEERTVSRFSVTQSRTKRPSETWAGSKIYFERNSRRHRIKFDGIPFIYVAEKTLGCMHGPDLHGKSKRKRLESRPEIYDNFGKKPRIYRTEPKKKNCPAKILIQEVLRFPDYKLHDSSRHHRTRCSHDFRKDAKRGLHTDITVERRFYIDLSQHEMHQNHPIGEPAGPLQTMDPRLIKKIGELVRNGIHNTGKVKAHLDDFVKNVLFQGQLTPPSTNKRFFPRNRDITNHIYKVKVKHGIHTQVPNEIGSRLVLQQCSAASLQLPTEYVSELIQIGRGVVVYICFLATATDRTIEKIVKLLTTIKLSENGDGKLVSVCSIHGDMLLIPQASLTGKVKGRSMQYFKNVDDNSGEFLYQKLCDALKKAVETKTKGKVKCGMYGSRNIISIDSHEPFTHIIDA